jgi:hypothetical protein
MAILAWRSAYDCFQSGSSLWIENDLVCAVHKSGKSGESDHLHHNDNDRFGLAPIFDTTG